MNRQFSPTRIAAGQQKVDDIAHAIRSPKSTAARSSHTFVRVFGLWKSFLSGSTLAPQPLLVAVDSSPMR
jgi:hypothetical protein